MIPGTFVFEGMVREYVLRVPPGWQQALTEARNADPNRLGLPLLVAFHGGRIGFGLSVPGDLDDPAQFQRDWDFPSVWAPQPGQERRFEDQCFVLYPYGLGATDVYQAAPRGSKLPPRRWGAWNPGQVFTPNDTPTDDPRFVLALIAHLDARLLARYRAERGGAPDLASVFDPERRFLFGRSNGGMMALRMVARSPIDTWAAVFVISAAIGGSPNAEGYPPPLTFNDPDDGATPTARGVSLFAVHGELDTHVPPGRHGNPTHPELTSDLAPPVMDAVYFTPSYAPLSDLIHAYRRFAGIGREATLTRIPPGDVRRWTSRRPNGVEVVEYRDATRGHFDDFSPIDARFVWEFLRDHPRPEV